ncbi:MAG TPA: PhzF family phenazine biosynthesis protein [Thermoanaerobaculia bacterium]|nr:PhzF family phenazine biosynthesis protein [Thermoanaerobaculia bacterium]
MSSRLFVVDAFTDRPFAGNPAGVCVLAQDRDDRWLQNVAREMNLSETAFLWGGPRAWRLRWFTPTVEIDLCGHATLASAHAIWESGLADPGAPLTFATKSGELRADGRPGAIEMDFPAVPAVSAAPPAGLLEALGVGAGQCRYTGRNRIDSLLEIDSESALRALAPDFRKLAAATRPDRGVIVTVRSESPSCDFVSRFFAPAAGIDEDPVTGSAHCCLGPYWAGRLGRTNLTGYQASARGGTVGVAVGSNGRVTLSGAAVTVSRGELV